MRTSYSGRHFSGGRAPTDTTTMLTIHTSTCHNRVLGRFVVAGLRGSIPCVGMRGSHTPHLNGGGAVLSSSPCSRSPSVRVSGSTPTAAFCSTCSLMPAGCAGTHPTARPGTGTLVCRYQPHSTGQDDDIVFPIGAKSGSTPDPAIGDVSAPNTGMPRAGESPCRYCTAVDSAKSCTGAALSPARRLSGWHPATTAASDKYSSLVRVFR